MVQTILVVEDEIFIREYLADILERAGYRTIRVSTGEKAINSVHHQVPDCILMDLGLQGISGLEAATKIREQHAVPIVFITAYSEDETIEQAQAISLSGYLVKPINEHQLLATVKLAIRQHHTLHHHDTPGCDHLRSIGKNLPDGIIYRLEIDRQGNSRFDYISEGFESLFGLSRDVVMRDAASFYACLHPEDRDEAMAAQSNSIQNLTPFRYECRFIHPDGKMRWIRWHSMPEPHDDGKILFDGVAMDITSRKQAEEELRLSLRQKDILLKEIHHRVKNNLQVVLSLLNMQSRKTDDPTTLKSFSELENRVRSMALVHQSLYLSKDITRIDLPVFLRTLVGHCIQTYDMKDVNVIFDITDIHLGINVAIPLGLITNELVTNAMKHAFIDGRTGEINLSCRYQHNDPSTDMLCLTVRDNGVGYAGDFSSKGTMGLELIQLMTAQLDGEYEFSNHAGVQIDIVFPLPRSFQ